MQSFDRPTYSGRVGYVLKRYPKFSETFIVNEILAHEAAGLDVHIYALRPPNDTHFQDLISRVKAPVAYLPVPKRSSEMWSIFKEAGKNLPDFWEKLRQVSGAEDAIDLSQAAYLANEIKRRGVTHLHAHFGTSATTVARLTQLFSDTPYSFTAHAKDIFHESVDLKDLYTKFADAAFAVTVSDFNLDFLSERFPSVRERLHRIYNGLDLETFGYSDPQARPARIVSVGRLVEKKGFPDLVEACRILLDRGKRFECVIIGSGELEHSLRQQISSSRLQEVVKLAGAVPQKMLLDEVRNASVFAAPCIVGNDGNRDGLPTVLLEAMALGTPCISTDVTGIPEVIRHNRTGLMINQHDPHQLADAIETLLNDPAKRVELSRRARQLIEADFDIKNNSAQIRHLFQRSERLATRYFPPDKQTLSSAAATPPRMGVSI